MVQCLIYVCELMEHCDVVKFFSAVSESSPTLESILHSSVLDQHAVKALEGPSVSLSVCLSCDIYIIVCDLTRSKIDRFQ